MPGAADLPARLGVVLAVIYAIFNEGYASAAREDWTGPSAATTPSGSAGGRSRCSRSTPRPAAWWP